MSLTPVYTCQICRRSLTLPGTLIVGEKPEAHQARVAELLSEHVATEHKQDFGHAAITANALMGMMMVSLFQHNDNVLKDIVAQGAAKVRRFTGRPEFLGRWRVTDAMIEGIVRQSSPNDSASATLQYSTVIEMLKSMRDQIDEAMEQPAAVTSSLVSR